VIDLALLDQARALSAREQGLAVVTTARANGSVHASVVNACIMADPRSGEAIVAWVARGRSHKLVLLRALRPATVVFRSGWEWVAIEGTAELVGPHDRHLAIDADELPLLLRQIYAAAVGGTPDAWAPLDATISDEGHCAVLVRPTRVYGSPVE
jgi:hypothetical protein